MREGDGKIGSGCGNAQLLTALRRQERAKGQELGNLLVGLCG